MVGAQCRAHTYIFMRPAVCVRGGWAHPAAPIKRSSGAREIDSISGRRRVFDRLVMASNASAVGFEWCVGIERYCQIRVCYGSFTFVLV